MASNPWRGLLRQLDLTGKDGGASFSKLMTVAVFVAAVALGIFSGWIALLVIAAAFGRTTLMALINRSSAQLDVAAETRALSELVKARRDSELGIEDSK